MADSGYKQMNIDRIVRLSLLILLIATSLTILAPFMIMVIWGIIIAVALFPMFRKSVKYMNGKKSMTAVLFTLVGLSILIVPSILLTTSASSGYQQLSSEFEAGTLTIPEPTEDVAEWPVIGEKLYEFWDLAAHNIRELFNKYNDQFRQFGSWLLDTLATLGLTILQFIVSIIIAGVLLAKSDMGEGTTFKFAKRLVGERGEEFVKLTTGTIRSVVQGILGIALIQCLAATILLVIFDVPVPGLWGLFILILAIMQLPPFLVLGPIIVYVYSVQPAVPATIFTVFAMLISISDSLLKPIFLGRGVDIPMLVVLLGAIGGMLVFGILGLFVGAVILTLSYKLMMAWLNAESVDN